MKKHDRLPDFSKLCAPEQTPISFFLSQQIYFFFLGSIGGFLWEVAIFLYRDKTFANRGFLYGPWLPVYGIGAVLLTVCLHPFIGKSDRWIFIGGSIIGGAFEYFCSWLQETVLGTVSWDYTGYPFNLNGRINLLYCLFWGALALVWVKEVFPRLNGFIERRVSKTYGVVISWVLIAFMLANSLVSGAAVLRQSQRYEGVPATHAWQQVLDDRFPDSRLAKIYPSMVRVEE